MAINDLFQALQMFQQGVQQYAITGAVNDANAQMQALNQAQIDEGQKRQQLQQLANGVALKLTGVGASGQQIQSAFNAINPQNFGSVEQMQLEGALSGNQYLQGTAGSILGEREAKAMRAEDRAFGRQVSLQNQRFQQELMIESMKAGAKGTQSLPNFQIAPGVKLTEKDQEELKATAANYDMIKRGLERMDAKVGQVGTEFLAAPQILGGGRDKRELEQEQNNIMLQLKELEKLGALAGPDIDALAKVIPDPTSASTGTYTVRSEAFKQQLNDRLQSRAMARGVRYTGDMFGGAQSAGGGNVQVRMLPDGTRIKVRQIAPGKYEEVP